MLELVKLMSEIEIELSKMPCLEELQLCCTGPPLIWSSTNDLGVLTSPHRLSGEIAICHIAAPVKGLKKVALKGNFDQADVEQLANLMRSPRVSRPDQTACPQGTGDTPINSTSS